MSANIDYFEDEAGEWRFRVKSGNSETTGGGEGYTRKADARRGLKDHAEAIVEALLEDEPDFAVELAARIMKES